MSWKERSVKENAITVLLALEAVPQGYQARCARRLRRRFSCTIRARFARLQAMRRLG
jgi:hypothetical protein